MINTKCTIIMYHYVRNLARSRFPNIKGLDEELFASQLDFLTKEYNVITMEDLIEAVDGNGELPPGAALLTFDDGYIDHYTTVFPHLFNRGLQGSFFVPAATIAEHNVLDVNKIHFVLASVDISQILKETYIALDLLRKEGRMKESNEELRKRLSDFLRFEDPDVAFIKSLLQYGIDEELRGYITNKLFEKFVSKDEAAFSHELYLSMDQIKLMKQCGMFFGLHGYKHYWLGKLEEAAVKNDILKALNFWDNIIDGNKWVMNYPCGSYNNKVIDFISTNGCALALTTNVSIADITGSRYELPRLDTNDLPPKSNNYLEIG